MDDHSGLAPIGVQYGARDLWRRILSQADRAECVSTVHEDVSHAEGLRGTTSSETVVSRLAESAGQHWDGKVTEPLGCLAH
jgi:hypothetical protein